MRRTLPATQTAVMRRPCPAAAFSLGREAVEQSRAAGAAQSLRMAAAGGMRGVPRLRPGVVDRPDPVVVARHRGAVGPALGPVATGPVCERRAGKRGAVGTGPGEDVVVVRLLRAPVHHPALLVQRRFLRDVVALR